TGNGGGAGASASAARNGPPSFVSERGAGRGPLAVSRARPEGKDYGPAEKLPGAINDPENVTLEALVAPDESYILLTPMGRSDGLGSFDIYVSRFKDGVWGAPANLGPKINTRARDYSPRFAPDGGTRLFTSESRFATEP